MNLKPHQRDLLKLIAGAQAPIPVDRLDGRNLRPLRTHDLVTDSGSGVVATAAGRALVDRPGSGGAQSRLSTQQEEVLRYLVRQTGPVPEDHLDGRVLRALRAQNLVTERAGWVSPSDDARVRLDRHTRRQSTARTPADGVTGGRADALLRAVDQLEAALPRDAEIMVSDVPVYADDILAGIRRLARHLRAGTRALNVRD